MWMSHVTHMNESCHTCEYIMSHIGNGLCDAVRILVCCSLLQCVAVCCSVLQSVAVSHNTCIRDYGVYIAVRVAVRFAVSYSELQCVAVRCITCLCPYCNNSLCVAVCCSVLQSVAVSPVFAYTATIVSVLQSVAVCCSLLQWVLSLPILQQ